MTLLEFARQSTTSGSDQSEAFRALDDFFASDRKCFLLKGYVGTGKQPLQRLFRNILNIKRDTDSNGSHRDGLTYLKRDNWI